jgi:hypothetical protein
MPGSHREEKVGPLLVPTSPGQVLDRITILQIKADKTIGLAIHSMLHAELAELGRYWKSVIPVSPELTALEDALRRVNSELWGIEDRLRGYELKSDFGADFVQAARSVYRLNDERHRLKCCVDSLLRSAFSEIKVYVSLKADPAGDVRSP